MQTLKSKLCGLSIKFTLTLYLKCLGSKNLRTLPLLLLNGNNSSSYIMQLLWVLKEIMHNKYLEQSRVHGTEIDRHQLHQPLEICITLVYLVLIISCSHMCVQNVQKCGSCIISLFILRQSFIFPIHLSTNYNVGTSVCHFWVRLVVSILNHLMEWDKKKISV